VIGRIVRLEKVHRVDSVEEIVSLVRADLTFGTGKKSQPPNLLASYHIVEQKETLNTWLFRSFNTLRGIERCAENELFFTRKTIPYVLQSLVTCFALIPLPTIVEDWLCVASLEQLHP
jgi:hypothetical protein